MTATHLRTVPSEDTNLLFLLVPQGGEELPDMAFSKTDRIFFSPNAIWEDPATIRSTCVGWRTL
jgi:hypothetical protein